MKKYIVPIVAALALCLGLSACGNVEHVHKWVGGKCDDCGVSIWQNGICADCGEEHSHNFDRDGFCEECGYTCPHETHDKYYLACNKCAAVVNHTFESGICEMCDATDEYIYGSVDAQYTTPDCQNKGRVEQVSYECIALAGSQKGKTITKRVSVYLPYGYDASKQYNIVYYLHGAMGTENDIINTTTVSRTQKFLDNIIDKNVCDPFIFACPSWFDSDVANKDFSGSLQENYNTQLRESIIPAVESAYSTYLECDGDITKATPEAIAASRTHRAIAGFSGGGTVAQMMAGHGLDMFAYFGVNSNTYNTEKLLESINRTEFKKYSVDYMLNTMGSEEGEKINDTCIENYKKVIAADDPRLIDGETMDFIRLYGLEHNDVCLRAALYNSMKLHFFKHSDAVDNTDYSKATAFTGTLTGSSEDMYGTTDFVITLNADKTIVLSASAYNGFSQYTDTGTYVINADGTISATFTTLKSNLSATPMLHNTVCPIEKVGKWWILNYRYSEESNDWVYQVDARGTLTAIIPE